MPVSFARKIPTRRGGYIPRNAWVSMSCGCNVAGLRFEYEPARPEIENNDSTKR
ncbi:hypothetical protein JOH50_007156 [Rhizobium leguminosarum]|nr:hypothetical protein [Rhizobium leguminosarum]